MYPSTAGIVNALVPSNVIVSDIPEINLKGNPANVESIVNGIRELLTSRSSKFILSFFLYSPFCSPFTFTTIK